MFILRINIKRLIRMLYYSSYTNANSNKNFINNKKAKKKKRMKSTTTTKKKKKKKKKNDN